MKKRWHNERFNNKSYNPRKDNDTCFYKKEARGKIGTRIIFLMDEKHNKIILYPQLKE
jgi:hypothetical protein